MEHNLHGFCSDRIGPSHAGKSEDKMRQSEFDEIEGVKRLLDVTERDNGWMMHLGCGRNLEIFLLFVKSILRGLS